MNNKNNLINLIGNRFSLTGSGRYLKTKEHDSLVIDTEKGLFFWNSRGIFGNALDWLIKVEGFDYKQAKILNLEENPVTVFADNNIKQEVDNTVLSEDIVNYFYFLGKYNREYWYKRAFTDETIELFRLGYYDGWYTIPVYLEGELKNIVMRRDNPKKAIKAWKKGVGALPFNFDILKYFKTIYFVEGTTDAISLVQAGLPAISTTAGSECFKIEWLKYFINIDRVYILYDNDSAGNNGSKKLAEKIGLYKCKIYNFWDFKEKYDVNDFFIDNNTSEDLLNLIETKSKYAFEME